MSKLIKIMVDDENNAEAFWEQFACGKHAQLAEELRVRNVAWVDQATWNEIREYQGFSDGPAYARDALILFDGDDVSQLNTSDNPAELGYELASDDGQGNQYWIREIGTVTNRLSRYEDIDTGEFEWSDDVSGWEE